MFSAPFLKRALVVAVAGAVTLGTLAPASASPYRRHYHNNGAAAGIFALGALGIGLAIANSHRHHDRYYDDGGDYYQAQYNDGYGRRYQRDRSYGYNNGPGLDRYGRGYRGPGRQYMPQNVPTLRSTGQQGGDH